uniref:Secreted protein n=1 Tax=Steinernema glaseri TaxID=37863 RepID=A0A1I7ZJR9_9BILA
MLSANGCCLAIILIVLDNSILDKYVVRVVMLVKEGRIACPTSQQLLDLTLLSYKSCFTSIVLLCVCY